jgi:hypothetical protein
MLVDIFFAGVFWKRYVEMPQAIPVDVFDYLMYQVRTGIALYVFTNRYIRPD